MPLRILTIGFKSDSSAYGKCQPACKPGSVRAFALDDHSSGASVAGDFARPTRAAGRKSPGPEGPCRPYSVLLPVGFAMPPPLPAARCALTAPFHPCSRSELRERYPFCGTFPGVAPAGRYPAPFSRGARTFLPRALSSIAAAVIRPAGAVEVEVPGSAVNPATPRGHRRWLRPGVPRAVLQGRCRSNLWTAPQHRPACHRAADLCCSP